MLPPSSPMRVPSCSAPKTIFVPRKLAPQRRSRQDGRPASRRNRLRDRLQRNHDSLQRLIAQQAATKDELAANDLDLAKAEAQVKQPLPPSKSSCMA